jgi:hypothetical protein
VLVRAAKCPGPRAASRRAARTATDSVRVHTRDARARIQQISLSPPRAAAHGRAELRCHFPEKPTRSPAPRSSASSSIPKRRSSMPPLAMSRPSHGGKTRARSTRPALTTPSAAHSQLSYLCPVLEPYRLPGRGGPPQFPPPPSIRSAPPMPGSSSRLNVQARHRFHGLHPDYGDSALPCPASRAGMVTTPQASRHATYCIVTPPSQES